MTAGLTAAVLLSGCGNGAERRTAPRPTLPRAVALRLAHASDGVAAALAAGDGCRARRLAQALQQQGSASVVPTTLRGQLGEATSDLARRIECIPPPRPPTVAVEPQDEGNGHDNGKHKGEKKHGKEHD